MIAMRRVHRAMTLLKPTILVAVTLLLSLVTSSTAFAASQPAPGSTGFDFSFPQCGDVNVPNKVAVGAPYQFAIIGVNHGKAFIPNDCLASEVEVAAAEGIPMSFVINLNAPRQTSSAGASDLTALQAICAPGDDACWNYAYGWSAGQDAYSYTEQTLQSLGETSVPLSWWMDIETANYWTADPSLNDQVIQGAIDFFQQTISGAVMGVYSAPSEWSTIAGPDYQPGVPTWLAGATSLAAASRLCSGTSLTGGPIALVQYATRRLDIDHAC